MSTQKLGRYDLTRVIGKGAMGVADEGRDPNLDRRVAIKTILVDNLTAEAVADYEVRFKTEAKSAARLSIPTSSAFTTPTGMGTSPSWSWNSFKVKT